MTGGFQSQVTSPKVTSAHSHIQRQLYPGTPYITKIMDPFLPLVVTAVSRITALNRSPLTTPVLSCGTLRAYTAWHWSHTTMPRYYEPTVTRGVSGKKIMQQNNCMCILLPRTSIHNTRAEVSHLLISHENLPVAVVSLYCHYACWQRLQCMSRTRYAEPVIWAAE